MNPNKTAPDARLDQDTAVPVLSDDVVQDPDSELARILANVAARPEAPPQFQGAVVGRLLGLVDEGRVPLVALPGGGVPRAALRARSTVDLHAPHVGRDVLLLFEDAQEMKPIIVGLLRESGPETAPALGRIELTVDGNRVILSAATELVLRCGKSRITLRQDGRIEVRGESITTHATGANRVQGGSVQLN
jgi:hypothetical protein